MASNNIPDAVCSQYDVIGMVFWVGSSKTGDFRRFSVMIRVIRLQSG